MQPNQPEVNYREWVKNKENFELGEVQFVQVEPSIWVANLIGQRDIKRNQSGIPPVRYPAIKIGITKVAAYAKDINATIHMPRIGCGLAGGSWDKIEPIIMHELIGMGLKTVVYDFD